MGFGDKVWCGRRDLNPGVFSPFGAIRSVAGLRQQTNVAVPVLDQARLRPLRAKLKPISLFKETSARVRRDFKHDILLELRIFLRTQMGPGAIFSRNFEQQVCSSDNLRSVMQILGFDNSWQSRAISSRLMGSYSQLTMAFI